ncbi:hypothetical protein [Peribacillus asahii]|uniref:hypothetical protein n=1 Tax=Peribacillus asahii TaxID=228899 RepID=UPI0013E3C5D1|nr:hypothetical protein [Peribacillus asahii]
MKTELCKEKDVLYSSPGTQHVTSQAHFLLNLPISERAIKKSLQKINSISNIIILHRENLNRTISITAINLGLTEKNTPFSIHMWEYLNKAVKHTQTQVLSMQEIAYLATNGYTFTLTHTNKITF